MYDTTLANMITLLYSEGYNLDDIYVMLVEKVEDGEMNAHVAELIADYFGYDISEDLELAE